MNTRRLAAILLAMLTVITLGGCSLESDDPDTGDECAWETQLQPMYVGEQFYLIPQQYCIPIPKQKEAK